MLTWVCLHVLLSRPWLWCRCTHSVDGVLILFHFQRLIWIYRVSRLFNTFTVNTIQHIHTAVLFLTQLYWSVYFFLSLEGGVCINECWEILCNYPILSQLQCKWEQLCGCSPHRKMHFEMASYIGMAWETEKWLSWLHRCSSVIPSTLWKRLKPHSWSESSYSPPRERGWNTV